MGIPEFTSFIDKHFTRWQSRELKGHLVIDGNNIMHRLWRCDWTHGGQFDEYKRSIKGFYKGLQEGRVKPIVVLDGLTHTGQKWPTYVKRREDKIKLVHKKLHTNEVVKDNVLPSLGFEVYMQVLKELRVEYIVVDDEADKSIVRIANCYNCPVLSSDMDFYIHNTRGGYIHFKKIKFCENDKRVKADVFFYRPFCEQFQFSDESVCLIIPVLCGNDFWSGFQSLVSCKGDNLLPYVQFASLFDSIESFNNEIPHFQNLSEDEKDKLYETCKESSNIYNSSKVLDKLGVSGLCTINKYPLTTVGHQ